MDVITLSSDSEDSGSDVEITGSFINATGRADILPLSTVRVEVDAVKVSVPGLYIDLTNPKWSPPALKLHTTHKATPLAVVDLTETEEANGTKQETAPPDDSQINKENTNKKQTSHKQDFTLKKSPSRDSTVISLQQDCGDFKPKQRRLDCKTQNQNQTDKAHDRAAVVKLRRLSFLETHVTELKTSSCSVYLNKDSPKMSLQHRQQDGNSEAPECINNLRTTAALNGPQMGPSTDESPPKVAESLIGQEEQENSNKVTNIQLFDQIFHHPQSQADSPRSDKGGSVATSKEHGALEDQRVDCCSPLLISSPTSPSSSQDKAQSSLQREVVCSKLEQLELDKAESSLGPNPSEPFDQVEPTPSMEPTLAEDTSEWQSEEADEASNSSDLHWSVPSDPPLSVSAQDMDDGSGPGTDREDVVSDSPVSCFWQQGSGEYGVNKEGSVDLDFRAASREDRDYVCPITLRKMMSGAAHALINREEEGLGTPEALCHPSLSLVYTTIEEDYPEGTLQLLSDLLQPGYYPPTDITSHLLRGILLEPQCPHHLCVQAFNLLMRTQRHHIADKSTVPWDWELLTSVTANQKHRCEVVRMFLDYVAQTLEDDFQAKSSVSALHHSIAKATLSCDHQFPRVRDVIKWLFSAIMKSAESGDSREAARERDEHIRMVYIFQRMLSLALDVDRSPALTSAKLSQELFHMLLSNIPLRSHRMLLLESLQSKLLRCKLLEHLLDYACPQKISLPMSLRLLLHFLKHCTLAPDPSDGTERWQRWEELVHLLWMLLLSYNKAMKGYLCSSVSEQRGRVGNLVFKPDDMVSQAAIREAVEAFLSRSQDDLGQDLPPHVEESLTYLQVHLLDVCQC